MHQAWASGGLLCVTLVLASSTVSPSGLADAVPESARRLDTSPKFTPSSVYFLGNSYTKRAALGDNFKQVAEERLGKSVKTYERATDGKQLWQWMQPEKDNYKRKKTNAFNFKGVKCPSVVVFQEQSAIAGFDADNYDFRKKVYNSIKSYWGPKAKKCDTRIAVYQTWGYLSAKKIKIYENPPYANIAGWKNYDEMQDAVIAGTQRYADALQKAGAAPFIVRVGEAYRRVKNDNRDLFKKLYAGDGSHPGAHGKFLINQVFFSTMFAQVSANWNSINESSWQPQGVTLAEAKYLAMVACSVALDKVCSLDTQKPVDQLTEDPTAQPTEDPTAQPTEDPIVQLTEDPTAQPTEVPVLCSNGLLGAGNSVCCSGSCSQCGGKGCGAAGDNCCTGNIKTSQKMCMKPEDIECLIPRTEIPTAQPTEDPIVQLTEDPTAQPTEVPVLCSNGLLGAGNSVCCSGSCSQCGGKGCGAAGDNCCTGNIKKSQKMCMKPEDTECLMAR